METSGEGTARPHNCPGGHCHMTINVTKTAGNRAEIT